MSRLKKKESCAGVSVCYPELWVIEVIYIF